MTSLLDNYMIPADMPDVSTEPDPKQLERARYLAMMRMGLGIAGREPIGQAMNSALAAWATDQNQARADHRANMSLLLQQHQVKQQQIEDMNKAQFLRQTSVEDLLAMGMPPAAIQAIKYSKNPVETFVQHKAFYEPYTMSAGQSREVMGRQISVQPDAQGVVYPKMNGIPMAAVQVPGAREIAMQTKQDEARAAAQYRMGQYQVGNGQVQQMPEADLADLTRRASGAPGAFPAGYAPQPPVTAPAPAPGPVPAPTGATAAPQAQDAIVGRLVQTIQDPQTPEPVKMQAMQKLDEMGVGFKAGPNGVELVPKPQPAAAAPVAAPPSGAIGPKSMGGPGVTGAPGALEASKAQQVELSKFHGQLYQKALEGEMAAPSNIDKLRLVENYFTQFNAGKAYPLTAEIKGWAQALWPNAMAGWTKDLGPAEAVQALTGEMALQLRNPSNGAGLPGAMSDRDLKFILSMYPNWSTNPKAVPLMIEARVRIEKRALEVGQIMRDYMDTHGQIDQGVMKIIRDHANANPLFSDMAGNPLKNAAVDTTAREGKPTGATKVLIDDLMEKRRRLQEQIRGATR